jgi:Ser/Thr protein kinase RdoA (MazF antagonist)
MAASVDDICEAFGLGAPMGPMSFVARGELGRVSRLATTTGRWAIKEIELFVPTVDEADANADLQETMLAGGVDLPRPRRTVGGHALFDNVRVYEWREMVPVTVAERGLDERVAELLARMHLQAPSTEEAPDPWYCEGPSRSSWDALVDAASGAWWATAVAELLPELVDAPSPLHLPARVCHLDVCPENVFVSDAGVIVIDWENAGPAATAQDLGSTLWDFYQGDVVRTRAFVAHYRAHGGPLERVDQSAFAMARVVYANLVDFHCRRTLESASTAPAHQRAHRALQGLLARPLTRRVVDDMMAAPV